MLFYSTSWMGHVYSWHKQHEDLDPDMHAPNNAGWWRCLHGVGNA